MPVEPEAARDAPTPPRPAAPPPGAAAVGRILDLPPLELTVVLFLRLWSEGPRGRAVVRQELAARLGPAAAEPALAAFEAAAGRAVALAAAGETEEAATLLGWIARPGAALDLAASAEEAGLQLSAGLLPPAARPGAGPRR